MHIFQFVVLLLQMIQFSPLNRLCFPETMALSNVQLPGCPRIVTRAEWGARDPAHNPMPRLTHPPKYFFIHHGASSPCDTAAQCAAKVRGYQNYHMNSPPSGHGIYHYCKCGYFRRGTFREHIGKTFHVEVIFAKYTKALQNAKISLLKNVHVYSMLSSMNQLPSGHGLYESYLFRFHRTFATG